VSVSNPWAAVLFRTSQSPLQVLDPAPPSGGNLRGARAAAPAGKPQRPERLSSRTIWRTLPTFWGGSMSPLTNFWPRPYRHA
jgi:hypothetical protein